VAGLDDLLLIGECVAEELRGRDVVADVNVVDAFLNGRHVAGMHCYLLNGHFIIMRVIGCDSLLIHSHECHFDVGDPCFAVKLVDELLWRLGVVGG